MGWKRSKDGGLDFDVQKELEYRRVIKDMDERHEKAAEKLLNRYVGSEHTMTFNSGGYPEVALELAGSKPLTAREKLQRFRVKKHIEYNKNI